MTEEELHNVLEGEDLLRRIDIRSMVLDLFKTEPIDKMVDIFQEKMPSLDVEYVKQFVYMRRM